jgi:hypothetical protein
MPKTAVLVRRLKNSFFSSFLLRKMLYVHALPQIHETNYSCFGYPQRMSRGL